MSDLENMKLFTYWRSTTSYRIRIALNLKELSVESIPVNLVAGEQNSPDYAGLNPGRGVPTLVLKDGSALTQSMAILEWLEETRPEPPLLPTDPLLRAQVRAAALVIAADIHPVNNLRVINKLKTMGHDQDTVVDWMNDWMTQGFTAFQQMLDPDAPYCFGNAPGLADLCLVPQLYNAHRWGCDLTRFKRLTEIEARCLQIPAFDAARPELQPDAN